MAEWVGVIGGLLMVMLIILFCMVLLQEAHVVNIDRSTMLHHCVHIGLWIGYGLLLMLCGDLACRVMQTFNTTTDPLHLWSGTSGSFQMRYLQDHFPSSMLFSQAVLPGFQWLYLLGDLLFSMGDHAALYLCLLCGGFSMWVLADKFGKTLTTCLPCAFLMFLPSSLSPAIACGLACALLMEKQHQRIAIIPAVAAAMLHPLGWGMLIVILVRQFFSCQILWTTALIWGLSLVTVLLIRWQGWGPDFLLITEVTLGFMFQHRIHRAESQLAAPLAILSAICMICLL